MPFLGRTVFHRSLVAQVIWVLKLVESHSQNQNDKKKRLYSRQTKVIAHFRGVIHTTNSTSTYKAGFEPAFEAKGAGALQKGQWPFCKGLTHNCQYETFCCEIHIWSRTCHAEDFWNIGILVKMIHHNHKDKIRQPKQIQIWPGTTK